MKRKVLYFSKDRSHEIQGVSRAGVVGVSVGSACDGSKRHGGGIISEMEVVGQSIVIRKKNEKGEPHRDFGHVNPTGQANVELHLCPADGVFWPMALTKGVVFVDEHEHGQAPQQGGKTGNKG